jgi:hypothetical protein
MERNVFTVFNIHEFPVVLFGFLVAELNFRDIYGKELEDTP